MEVESKSDDGAFNELLEIISNTTVHFTKQINHVCR